MLAFLFRILFTQVLTLWSVNLFGNHQKTGANTSAVSRVKVSSNNFLCDQAFTYELLSDHIRNKARLKEIQGLSKITTLKRLQTIAVYSDDMQTEMLAWIKRKIENNYHQEFLFRLIFKTKDGTPDLTGGRESRNINVCQYYSLNVSHCSALRDHLFVTLLDEKGLEKVLAWEGIIARDKKRAQSLPVAADTPEVGANEAAPSTAGPVLTSRGQTIYESTQTVQPGDLRFMMTLSNEFKERVLRILSEITWNEQQLKLVAMYYSEDGLRSLLSINKIAADIRPKLHYTVVTRLLKQICAVVLDRLLPIQEHDLIQHADVVSGLNFNVDKTEFEEILKNPDWDKNLGQLRAVLRWDLTWNQKTKLFLETNTFDDVENENLRIKFIFTQYFGLDVDSPQDSIKLGTAALHKSRIDFYVNKAFPKFRTYVEELLSQAP